MSSERSGARSGAPSGAKKARCVRYDGFVMSPDNSMSTNRLQAVTRHCLPHATASASDCQTKTGGASLVAVFGGGEEAGRGAGV